jgi:D-proline reductase (dithiol) PrdB
VCAIGWYLEEEGIMTTGISLVRENAEAMQPPRMLWVSFPLGRPLGRAGDAAFQHRVIAHALDLLHRPDGPVLEDYPEDMDEQVAEAAPACPVSFGPKRGDTQAWCDRLLREFDSLRPWYELSMRRRGRTTVGLSADGMQEILEKLSRWLDDPSQPMPDFLWFKRAIEDAKAWYAEALTAQPGEYPPGYGERLLWEQTTLGDALKHYYEYFHSQPDMALFARLVASREAMGGSTGGAEQLRGTADRNESGDDT